MPTGASLLLVTFVLWPLPLSRPCAQGSLALDGTYGFGSIFAEHGSPCGGAPTFYGAATSGTGGLAPTLDSSGGFAFLGNSDFAFEIDQALPGAAAFLACSVAPGTGLPLFGGMAWFDPSTLIFVQPFTLASVGSATVSSPIPADPPLDGADIHVQVAVLDPGAGAGISMTAGLKVPLRR